MKLDIMYNGWRNKSTWNVALWINNDENNYNAAVDFMKNYKGKNPYKSFIHYMDLENWQTPDGIRWISHLLDYQALNEMMMELK